MINKNVQLTKNSIVTEYLKSNEIGYDKCQIKLNKIEKSLCSHFFPFKEYFNNEKVLYVLPPSPKYFQK